MSVELSERDGDECVESDEEDDDPEWLLELAPELEPELEPEEW